MGYIRNKNSFLKNILIQVQIYVKITKNVGFFVDGIKFIKMFI